MSTETLLTPQIISKETLEILENNLVMGARINRQFENLFVKIGSTLTIRKPNRFVTNYGQTLVIQNITEPSTNITVNTQFQVGFQFTNQELTLTVEEFSDRYLKPAAATIANSIDYQVASLYTGIANFVGNPGTVPNAYSFLTLVGKRMDQGAVPQDGRVLVLGPDAYWSMDAALIGLFVKTVSEPALKGFLANLANFEIYQDQNIQAQTVGNYGGTPVINGAGQTGSSLVTNGWTASITGLLNVGDVIQFPGVYAVNPQSRVATSALQTFVITATANSDSGGNATLQISPAITTSGPYQNVSASPANLAPITVQGAANTSYFQNIAFVKDTFGMVTVPLELPEGVDFKARETYKGISMAIIRDFDIVNYSMPCRLDCLAGFATYYPELGVRLTN